MLIDAIDLTQLKRVLVIKLRHHGDVLLTSPVFHALQTAAPHIKIDALIYQETYDMLEGHPAINRIWLIKRASKKYALWQKLCREWQSFWQLRRQQYDLIIHLTDHHRGAWLTRLLKPRYAVAPMSKKRFFRRSFTHLYPVIGGNRRHTVEIHLDALRRIGIYPDKQRRLILTHPAAADIQITTLLSSFSSQFIVIHPASRWSFKCWPADAMRELLEALVQRGMHLVITGASSEFERDYIAQILPHSSAVLNLQGKLSIKELAALIARGQLFIGMDSMPMHIAAAMGVPTIALFGPSGDIEWGPWQTPHRIITAQYACRPCGKAGCGNGKQSECLEAISVQAVLTAITQLHG